MNILMVYSGLLPETGYSGVGRVVWSLIKSLDTMGHTVTLLSPQGALCPYAKVIYRDPLRPIEKQIPPQTDIVHYHDWCDPNISKPYILSMHSVGEITAPLNRTIFTSRTHATLAGSTHFIYSGLDWDSYGDVDITKSRRYHHFLANRATRESCLRGAINIIRGVKGGRLRVLGGRRFDLHGGVQGVISRRVGYCGFVSEERKRLLLEGSRGLIYPTLECDSFSISVIESLYFGAPIFASNVGSLTEIVSGDFGYLSNSEEELQRAIRETKFSPQRCHQYAYDCFNSQVMALQYLKKYDTVITKGEL